MINIHRYRNQKLFFVSSEEETMVEFDGRVFSNVETIEGIHIESIQKYRNDPEFTLITLLNR